MVRCLGAKFHLAEPHVRIAGGLINCFREKLRIHEMRAGAGDEETAVLYKLHTAEIDLAVTADRRLDGSPGLGKSGRVENDDVILLSL